jgi:putative membrane protein
MWKRNVAWSLALVLVACRGGGEAADQPAADAPVAESPAPPAPPPLADADIAHIAVTANTIDIEAAEQAKQKSQNAEVKAFANTMIKDHTGVNQQAGALAQSLNLTPADNATSQQLKSQADAAKAELSAKTGADFDRAYIAREIAYHQAVLDALDQTLIPNAQNAELKGLLEKVRPAVASHLQMAQQLQGKLGT